MVGKIAAIVLFVAQSAAWAETATPTPTAPSDTRLVVMIYIRFR